MFTGARPLGRAARRAMVGAAAAALGMSALSLTSAQATTGTVVMSANVLYGINRLTPTGTPSSSVLTIGIGVARPNPAGETALLHALYDPHSPQYRQFLSVADFAQAFGVPQSRRDALTSWLRGGGLHVFMVTAPGDLVMAQGTAQQVDSLFNVTEHTYTYHGSSFIANDRAPTVPAGLGITTVMGLNTYQHASIPQRTASQAGLIPACNPGGFCLGTMQAEDMWSLYDMPASTRGKGQRIAILGEGVLGNEQTQGSVIADLRKFEDEHHFPHVPLTVHCVINNDCGSDTLGSTEWDLDQAASTGMAPDIDHLDYYFAQSLTDSNQAAMIGGWLSDPHGALQANASFAECEQGPYNAAFYAAPGNVDGDGGIQAPIMAADPVLGLPFLGPTGDQLGDDLEAYAEPALQSAAIMGRTLFAAAGDTGSGCTALVADGIGPNGIAPEPYPTNPYPAGARYAVAVGGTVIYRTSSDGSHADTPATRFEDYSWPYTGGGSSPFLTAPDYQQNVTAVNGKCVTDQDGGTGATGLQCRGVPDVAALSGDLTVGYAFVSGGSDTANGGTSLASPLWVGSWTRIQAASHLHRGLGFANYTLYAIGQDSTKYARDFYDITVGSNGGPCPTGPCVAQAGWDYVSGWGEPEVAHLIADTQVKQEQVSISGGTMPITSSNGTGGGGQVSPAVSLPNTSGTPLGGGALLGGGLALAATAWIGRRRRTRAEPSR